jgi:hypothetical protein
LDEVRRAGTPFDAIVCCLVLCVLDEGGVRAVMSDIRSLADGGTRVAVAVCNPDYISGTTCLQKRMPPSGADVGGVFRLSKQVFSTGALIEDVHRPLQWYLHLFGEHGFLVTRVEETPAVDFESLEPTSDFTIFWLQRARAKRGIKS